MHRGNCALVTFAIVPSLFIQLVKVLHCKLRVSDTVSRTIINDI